MQNANKVAIMRGAGIGFMLSSLVFIFTWNPFAFLLIPIGVVVGLAISRLAPRLSFRENPPRSTQWMQRLDVFRRALIHPNLLVRTLSLLLLGAVLFLLAWSIGYYLLPEAAFRSGGEAMLEARGLGEVAESVSAEWLGILANNLLPVALIVIANLLLRVNGLPFGYVIPLFNLTGYGLFIGTNSFLIPYPERLAPTFAILERSGPYEMVALVIIAAATATWSIYHVRHLFQTVPSRVEGAPRITWQQVIFLLLGVVLLAGAAWREAAMIVGQA